MTTSRSQQLIFIAILPPQDIQDEVNQIKQEFAEYYASQAAQKYHPTLPCNHLLSTQWIR